VSRPWSPRTRTVAGVAAWLAVLVAATLIGITAVNAIGSGIVGAGEAPLSPSEVDARLSATPSPPPVSSSTPVTTTTTGQPPAPAAHAFPSQGGTVIARCVPGGVEIVSATPAQGYQVSSSSHEIDDHPSVRFTSGRTEIEVRLRCVGDTPRPEIRNK
jgi:hypothetical protein